MKAFVTVTQQQFDISAEQGVPEYSAFVTVSQEQFIIVVQDPTGDVLTQSVEFGNFIKGKDGTIIYNGSGVPTNTLGVNDDFYIDNVAPNNYYKKISGVWVLQGHFQGEQGEYTVITIGENGNWYIDGADSGQRSIGIDGYTPIIGENDNWWINGVDTGKRAVGIDGVGISNWELVSTVGKVKTYRITFTDSTTFEYSITDGTDGNDGREVLIQNNGTYIQWQYEGDEAWNNIVALTALKGDSGANIELQKSITHIQWRVVGDTNWIDLVALVDLKGDAGYTPQKGVDYFDGLTPYIGMNGNWWIGDVDQNIKAEGVDGISPTIGLNGNWYFGAVDTGVKAQGQDGYTPIKGVDYFDGITPTIGLNKHWFIGAIDTGIVAEGKDGEDGVTPIITIGENENWYINGVDSGKPSRGANGTSAYDIYLAGGGTLSEVEFNESITDIPAHIEDATKHIDTTTAEFSGTIDETNDKFTIWDNSLLKWIRFSFTNLKTFIGTYFLKLDQTTPQTLSQSPKITSLTEGQLVYVDANKQLKPIAVFWDIINGRMGIGISPTYKLDVNGEARISPYLDIVSHIRLASTTGFGTIRGRSALGLSLGANDSVNMLVISTGGNVGIGTTTPKSKLQVAGGIQCGDDTAAASADKVGTTRYRATANASYVEMCMQVSASSYSWVAIVTNTW